MIKWSKSKGKKKNLFHILPFKTDFSNSSKSNVLLSAVVSENDKQTKFVSITQISIIFINIDISTNPNTLNELEFINLNESIHLLGYKFWKRTIQLAKEKSSKAFFYCCFELLKISIDGNINK